MNELRAKYLNFWDGLSGDMAFVDEEDDELVGELGPLCGPLLPLDCAARCSCERFVFDDESESGLDEDEARALVAF
jgi:hypothetical protein